MKKGISTVLLSYKEADNLRVLLPEIKEMLGSLGEEYEIIVVDSMQPQDDTESVCKENGCRYINQEEPFFGGAFRTGIKYAEMDKFLILDSDGSHKPCYIPDIYHKFLTGDYDVVIGSRYVKGGRTEDARTSVVMSHILNGVFRFCLGIKAKDISTDYRMYRTEQLKEVQLTRKNYDILQEVLVRIKQLNGGIRIGEVPISFSKRLYGESKRRLIPFIIDYGKSLLFLTAIQFPLVYNFALYGLFGILAAVLEYGIFTVLMYFHIVALPEVANVIGAVAGFLFTFTSNTFLNFKKSDKLAKRFGSYAAICLLGLVLSTSVISCLKDKISVYVLKAFLLVSVSCVQFLLNRYITYRD